jgi:hypothetical protein
MEETAMRVNFFKFFGRIAALGLCLAWASFGQTLTLTGAATGVTECLGGDCVYASPYLLSINGATNSVQMYCDDFVDNITPGETWDVTSLTLAQITAGLPPGNPPQFQSNATDSQAVLYIAAVDLAVQINNLTPADPTENQDRSDLSAALWDVMEPGVSSLSGFTPQAAIDAANALNFASGLEGSAKGTGTVITQIDGYAATIYTPSPDDKTSIIPGCPSCTAPQEFIQLTSVPEPSTWAFLGFYFVGAGMLGLYFRRRNSRAS